jgi:XRE family transcriptional regulator, regulator of sulfur utilization
MPTSWKQRGMKIKELREARGWTQETLARKARVSRVTIGRIEIGHSRPSLDLVERLAKVFKVKVSELLE